MDFHIPKLNLDGSRPDPHDDSNRLFSKEIQDQLDQIDLLMHPEKKTEKYPSWSDVYIHRTTTKWPPLDWNPITPYSPYQPEHTDTFLTDYNKKWNHNDDSFKHQEVDVSHHRHSPVYIWVPIICVLPLLVILVVFLVIFFARRRNKWIPAAAVLPNGRVIGPGPGPVQQNQQMTPMMPPGQGGAVPTNVPYSDNFNRPYNDDPPPYPTDADLQVNNSGIGFRNEVAPVPSAPPPYSDNSEPVESLNFGLNKEKAGQGTRNADEKESVKYVNEKSVHK